ncbi:MAG TPA: hypothetical protein VFZ42_08585 [Chitinophagaceae bacterium]
MLDQLLNLVRKHAGDAIVTNPSIPNERNDEAIAGASGSIVNSLQSMLQQGNITDLLGMFAGRSSANQAVNSQVSGGLIQDLMARFGLNPQQAGSVANRVVPGVLNDMVTKTNDPNDNSFNIQQIFNNLSGGQTSGFNMQALLDKLKGGKLDFDGDGDTDLQDLLSLVKGGGLMNKVKGLFN